MHHELIGTALVLTTVGVLLAVSVLFGRAVERVRVPVVLVFLGIGMLAGSEGIGGIAFESYSLAYRLGTIALALILFDGGLNTPRAAFKEALGPAATLATLGVVLTAGIMAVGARLLGMSWPIALVIGAVASSTDAAAVFSVLRGGGIHLRRRLGVTLELESGLNDPMAVILTTILVQNVVAPGSVVWWRVPLDVGRELLIGAAAGVGIGYAGRWLMSRMRLAAGGLYPALTLALAALAFGVPTLVGGSGFLAVYIAAVIIGNGHLPYRAGLLRVHDAIAWLAQIAMFLMLGLLVFPSRLPAVVLPGLALSAILVALARPIAAMVCLLPWRMTPRETIYVGWVGLRGAVPIVLATFPVLAGVPGADRLFALVFFVVLVSTLVQGGSIPWLTRYLHLVDAAPPPPPAAIEIASLQELEGEVLSYFISPESAAAGARVAELPFPDTMSVMLVVRGHALIPPRGATVLEPGDHVFVLAQKSDPAMLSLIFGAGGE